MAVINQLFHEYLTIENFDDVVDTLEAMVKDRTYTWVTANSDSRDGYDNSWARPEVRVDQRIDKIVRSLLPDGRPHVTVCDTYGVFGLHTDIPDRKTANALAYDDPASHRLTYISIDAGQFRMRLRAPGGNHLCWVIAPNHPEWGDR